MNHVSDLRWDRWLAGELPADDTAELLAHVAECAACGARRAELVAQRDAFRARPFPIALKRRAPRRAWLAAGAAAVAAASVALIVVARGRGEPLEDRPKGTGAMLVLAAGRGSVTPVSAGDVVHPGDSLQAGYTAARDGFGAVLALDGAGAANVYVPSAGPAMVPLPAGTDRSFPASTQLDDVVGPERVIIVWCEAPYALAPLVAELRARGDVTAPLGCDVRRVALDKRAVR